MANFPPPIDLSSLDPSQFFPGAGQVIDDAGLGPLEGRFIVKIINPTNGPIVYSFKGVSQVALPSHIQRTHKGSGHPKIRFDRGLNDDTDFDYDLDSGRTYYFKWVKRDFPEIGVVNVLDLFLGFPPTTSGNDGGGAGVLNIGSVVTLECLGNVPGPRFLDGHTGNGTVALAPQTGGGFSGTKWKVVDGGNGTVIFQCLGTIAGPHFLDGRTANNSVALAPQTGGVFTGTHWKVRHSGDAFTFECQGNIPGLRFLDGHTGNGSVALAPQTGGGFTGTKWRAVVH
jgi:predicted Rdx family selenoprotein